MPQKLFEFLLTVINAPIQTFLQAILHLISEPVNLTLFVGMWAVVIYVISMFYTLFAMWSGFNFVISGYDVTKREKAKAWLRNILVMMVLVQASFFLYELVIDLSATLTAATLTLIDPNFFLIGVGGINDLGMALLFGSAYLATLVITALVFVIRYAFVSLGVVLFPLAIFFYFTPVLRQYGSLLFNFLGTAIFVTIFAALLLAGFSQLSTVSIFSNIRIILLICTFLCISGVMLFALLFSIVKSAFSVYHDIKGMRF